MMHGREKKCTQNFDARIRRQDTNRKKQSIAMNIEMYGLDPSGIG
jgi:hypothetical protein